MNKPSTKSTPSKGKKSKTPADSSADKPAAPRRLDASLTKLASADVIRLLTEELDPTYIFKHQLVQETTYDTMLKTKRAELHRLVAETIEKLAPDQLEENAAVLAFHYQRGGWDDMAFVYAALAGDVAWRAYAHTEALAHYDFAVQMAGRLDTELFNPRIREVYTKRGRIFEVLGESADAIQNYHAMIAFAQRAKDPLMEAEGLNHLVTVQSVQLGSPSADAVHHLERALELARQAGDQALIGRTLWNMGLIRRFSEQALATDYFQQALELARSANLGDLAGYALTELTIQMEMLGRAQAARDYADQALMEFRALDNQPMVVDALAGRSVCSFYLGEVDASRAAAEEGIRISRATENIWGGIYNQLALLQTTCDVGDFDRLLSEGEGLRELTRQVGFPPFRGFILNTLIRALLELGQLERAQALGEECFQALDQMGVPIWQEVGRSTRGLVMAHRGNFDEAHAMLDPLWQIGDDRLQTLFSLQFAGSAIPALALAQGRLDFGISFCNWMLNHHAREKTWRLACDIYYYRGLLHHAGGHLDLAERDLDRAREIAEQTRYRLLLWHVDAALGKIYAQRDEKPRAREARQRAADLLRALAQNISDPPLRDSFLARPEAADVLAAV